jgi:hypothetical protein
MFSILECSACCRPCRTWIAFNGFSAIFDLSVPHSYLGFTHWIIPESLLNHSNSFRWWMSRFETKLDACPLICSPSHCEYDGHTVHKLTQQCLTADWVAPWESDCSRMCSKVFFVWLSSRPCDLFSRYSILLDSFRTDIVLYPSNFHC